MLLERLCGLGAAVDTVVEEKEHAINALPEESTLMVLLNGESGQACRKMRLFISGRHCDNGEKPGSRA
jgi:hypothetical protein